MGTGEMRASEHDRAVLLVSSVTGFHSFSIQFPPVSHMTRSMAERPQIGWFNTVNDSGLAYLEKITTTTFKLVIWTFGQKTICFNNLQNVNLNKRQLAYKTQKNEYSQ